MANPGAFHESYQQNGTEDLPSDRKFGLVMAGFFTLVGVLPLRTGHPPRVWALALAAALLAAALVVPRILRPCNRVWMRLGVFMGHVVGMIGMALLFGLVFTPAALWLRVARKDLLRLRWVPDAPTYWMPRSNAGPTPESMRHLF